MAIEAEPRPCFARDVQELLLAMGLEVSYTSLAVKDRLRGANRLNPYREVFLFGLCLPMRRHILDANDGMLPITPFVRPNAFADPDALFVGPEQICDQAPIIDKVWTPRILRSRVHPVNGAARLIIKHEVNNLGEVA